MKYAVLLAALVNSNIWYLLFNDFLPDDMVCPYLISHSYMYLAQNCLNNPYQRITSNSLENLSLVGNCTTIIIELVTCVWAFCWFHRLHSVNSLLVHRSTSIREHMSPTLWDCIPLYFTENTLQHTIVSLWMWSRATFQQPKEANLLVEHFHLSNKWSWKKEDVKRFGKCPGTQLHHV
jgi:hypothetical protein